MSPKREVRCSSIWIVFDPKLSSASSVPGRTQTAVLASSAAANPIVPVLSDGLSVCRQLWQDVTLQSVSYNRTCWRPPLLSPAPTDKSQELRQGAHLVPTGSAIRPRPSGKMMAGHREHSRRLKIHAALSFGYAGPMRTSDWRTSLSCSEPRTAIRSPLGFDLDLRKEGGRRPLPFAPEEYRDNIMRTVRTLAVVGLIAIAGWTPTCAAERVDLLLVLAADISRSVDEVKFQLQRSGYAAAFSDYG